MNYLDLSVDVRLGVGHAITTSYLVALLDHTLDYQILIITDIQGVHEEFMFLLTFDIFLDTDILILDELLISRWFFGIFFIGESRGKLDVVLSAAEDLKGEVRKARLYKLCLNWGSKILSNVLFAEFESWKSFLLTCFEVKNIELQLGTRRVSTHAIVRGLIGMVILQYIFMLVPRGTAIIEDTLEKEN